MKNTSKHALVIFFLFDLVLLCFRYDDHLSIAAKFGMNKGFGIGVGMAIFQVVVLSNYALSLW